MQNAHMHYILMTLEVSKAYLTLTFAQLLYIHNLLWKEHINTHKYKFYIVGFMIQCRKLCCIVHISPWRYTRIIWPWPWNHFKAFQFQCIPNPLQNKLIKGYKNKLYTVALIILCKMHICIVYLWPWKYTRPIWPWPLNNCYIFIILCEMNIVMGTNTNFILWIHDSVLKAMLYCTYNTLKVYKDYLTLTLKSFQSISIPVYS